MIDGSTESGRVLVLDDEEMVTRSLKAIIEVESPLQASVFNRASDALEAMQRESFQAVVSDFLMPEMDGIEFLKQAREISPFASRILLTGYADKKNAIRSINEVGLFNYIEKPWDNDALLMVLRNAVERSHLLVILDDKVRLLAESDRSLETFRDRLIKTIL